MKLNEIKPLPSASFVVEVIEGPENTRQYVLRSPNGAPIATYETADDVALFLSELEF